MVPDVTGFQKKNRNDRHSFLVLSAASLAITFLLPLLILSNQAILSYFNGKLYDEFLARRGPDETSGQIVIVDIDEESLTIHGQWPWPRYKIAALVDALGKGGAAAIGIDIIFAEGERLQPTPLRDNRHHDSAVELGSFDQSALSDSDRRLAVAVSTSPTVLGYHFHFDAAPLMTQECLLHPLLTTGGSTSVSADEFSLQASHATCNIEALATAAGRSGFLNTAPDIDGILRQVSMLLAYNERFYPSLGLAVVLKAKGIDYVRLSKDVDDYILQLGETIVPLTSDGRMLLDYRGAKSTFPHIPASAVLSGTFPASSIKGRIVLVGTTAVGLKELRPTPLDPLFPGVEVHATVADNLLSGNILYRPSYAPAIELVAAIVCGILYLLAVGRAGAWRSLPVFLGGAFFLVFTSFTLFSTRDLYISPILPLLVLGANFSLLNLVKFRQKEVQAKKQVEELALAQASIIEGMASLTESRHQETGQHITRTQEYVRLLARLLQRDAVYGQYIDDDLVNLLYNTAPLHDIGKVGVPDRILLKEGKLTTEEFEEIKKHPGLGKDIIVSISNRMGDHPFLLIALDLIYTHHEKWNGTGYPRGLKGEEIPLAGRIMAIVDMYDALTSRRVYKDILSHEEAIAIMQDHGGTSFDPRIFSVFMDNNERFRQAATPFNNTGLSAGESEAA